MKSLSKNSLKTKSGKLCLAATLITLLAAGNLADAAPAKHAAPASSKSRSPVIKAKPNVVTTKSKAATLSSTVAKPKAVPGSKLFMWKMTSESGATIYFVGTIHVSRPDFYPLPEEMEKAFDKSQELLVEVVSSKEDEKKAKSLFETKGFYPKGDDLSQHVSRLTMRALQKYCAGEDESEDRYLKMKPWYAAMAIEYFEMARGGYLQSFGIDNHFMDKAKKLKKKIIGVETEEFHVNVLAELDSDLQDQMLKATLLDLDQLKPTGSNKLFKAWKEGDDKGMDYLLTKNQKEHPELMPYEERLLYARNETMAETIEPYLKGKDTFMVAVGSAHLVGERSILELLKKRGYQYTQVLVGDNI